MGPEAGRRFGELRRLGQRHAQARPGRTGTGPDRPQQIPDGGCRRGRPRGRRHRPRRRRCRKQHETHVRQLPGGAIRLVDLGPSGAVATGRDDRVFVPGVKEQTRDLRALPAEVRFGLSSYSRERRGAPPASGPHHRGESDPAERRMVATRPIPHGSARLASSAAGSRSGLRLLVPRRPGERPLREGGHGHPP